MYAPFDQLPDTARIWIYQSARAITPAEHQTISLHLHAFTQQWQAHGAPLRASFQILHNRFIILAVDEAQNSASGCSIDEAFRQLKKLEEKLAVNLINHTTVSFLTEDGNSLTIPVKELQQRFAEGVLHSGSLVFDCSITTKGELTGKWIVPAGNTWLKRYLDKVVAS